MTDIGFWASFWQSDAVYIVGLGLLLGAFDRIFELIIELRNWFNPLTVVDQFEEAVVLRFGKYHRTIGPGLHWIWPCSVEEVFVDTVVRRTAYLQVQSLTTRDGKNINSSPIVIYRIRNIKRWLLEVDDAADAINDITYGLNDHLCSQTDWDELHTTEYAEELTELVKAEGTRWGASIEKVKFSDRSNSRSMRLWTGDGMSSFEDDD